MALFNLQGTKSGRTRDTISLFMNIEILQYSEIKMKSPEMSGAMDLAWESKYPVESALNECPIWISRLIIHGNASNDCSSKLHSPQKRVDCWFGGITSIELNFLLDCDIYANGDHNWMWRHMWNALSSWSVWRARAHFTVENGNRLKIIARKQ